MFALNLELLYAMDSHADDHLIENVLIIDLCMDYWQPEKSEEKLKIKD